MINRILALSEDVDGLPIVPGATVTEQTGGHYSAQGPEEDAPDGAVNAKTRPEVARLWRAKDGPTANTGLYAVQAEAPVMSTLDRDSKGLSMANYSKTAASSGWPVKNGAACAIPSVTGPDDVRPVKPHPVQPLVNTGPYKPPEDPGVPIVEEMTR